MSSYSLMGLSKQTLRQVCKYIDFGGDLSADYSQVTIQ